MYRTSQRPTQFIDLLIGAGDKLRGGILDFVDSATGTGGHHAETDVGDAKMRQGIADTRQRAPTSASTATGSAQAAGAQPTSTSATAPTTTGSTL